jgi:hypothetical protein
LTLSGRALLSTRTGTWKRSLEKLSQVARGEVRRLIITLFMAAERVGRHARALEIEPGFVDVAIRRWQAFTRRDAIQAQSGLSFDEIAASSSERARHASSRTK